MYDELMCFYLFGLDSGFSQSGDIDELAMEVNMEGSRIDTGLAFGQPIPENWPIGTLRISSTVQLGHGILQIRPGFSQQSGNGSIWPIRVGQG